MFGSFTWYKLIYFNILIPLNISETWLWAFSKSNEYISIYSAAVHPWNIEFIVVTLEVSKFDKSISFKDSHWANILLISITNEVFKCDKSIDSKPLQSLNIDPILLIGDNLKIAKSIDFNELHPVNM